MSDCSRNVVVVASPIVDGIEFRYLQAGEMFRTVYPADPSNVYMVLGGAIEPNAVLLNTGNTYTIAGNKIVRPMRDEKVTISPRCKSV